MADLISMPDFEVEELYEVTMPTGEESIGPTGGYYGVFFDIDAETVDAEAEEEPLTCGEKTNE